MGAVRLSDRLADLSNITAPPELRYRVLADLGVEDRLAGIHAPPRRIAWRPVALLTLAAAALLLALGVSHRSADFPAQLVRSAVVELSDKPAVTGSDPIELGRWLQARTGYTAELPAISNARLIGAGVADLEGVPTAVATYLIAGGRLVYVALPNASVLGRPVPRDEVHTASVAGFNVAMWREETGSVRALVARIAIRDIVAVARECKRMAAAAN